MSSTEGPKEDGQYVFNLGGSVNALSLSPDNSHVVLAGREVLKIISLKNDRMTEVNNLRPGGSTNKNLSYSSVDVKWHPMEQHKNVIATAATNGAVVVWNVNIAHKQERVINDHTRTVNRISWHPEHAYTLLSGSQDGTMKLWDIRDHKNCKVTFDGKAESVRDVHFSPFYPNYFAAAFENGHIQIWDIRKNSVFERKLTAHQGPVFCIRWHPDDKSLIASGGRDRFIQVWDLNGTSKPIYSIETVLSVARVEWRPGHRFQIGSSALMDWKIHLWDLKRPFIPYASFSGHRDIVTDIQWPSNDRILSCGKDSNLMQQPLQKAYKPYEHIRTVGLSWTPRNELAVMKEKINRFEQDESATNFVLPSFFGGTTIPADKDRDSWFLVGTDGNTTTVSMGNNTANAEKMAWKKNLIYSINFGEKQRASTFDHQIYSYLAENYRISGLPFRDLCEHNSQVAAEVEEYQIAQTWKILQLYFENEEIENPPPSIPSSESFSEQIDLASREQRSNSQVSIPDTPAFQPIIENSIEDLDSQLDVSALDISAEPASFNLDDDFISSDLNPLSSLPTTSVLIPPTPPPPMTVNEEEPVSEKPKAPEKPRVYGVFFENELRWTPKDFVLETLQYYAENGDVQTAVVMANVLGNRISLPPTRLRHWTVSYIDLLHRLQLWSVANQIVKDNRDTNIRIQNLKSTTIHTSCPSCNKPLTKLGWMCDKCRKPTNPCSLCNQVVRGLYVWCQDCGHGGHLNHLAEWFAAEKFCPTGCGHSCSYKFVQKKSDLSEDKAPWKEITGLDGSLQQQSKFTPLISAVP